MSPTCHQIRVHDRRSGVTHEHRFTVPVIRIGRDPTCELHLADPFVSAHHAVLEADEHGARLRDLGGTNGLRVAGRRLAPHTAIAITDRLRVSLGPFDLELLHTADRERRATHGAVEATGQHPQSALHATLRTLHALHTPLVAARHAFESALADALHALHARGDLPTARRLLAEFPPEAHAHLLLPDLSPRPSELPTPDLSQRPPSTDLSQRPPYSPSDLSPPDLSQRPPSLAPPDLSQRPPSAPPDLSQRPPLSPPDRSPDPLFTAPHPSPSTPPVLHLIATAARDLLPHARPPASLDEARRFLARLVDTVRSFAAGLTTLQRLRRLQLTELRLDLTPDINPLLAVTSADEFLPALLARDDRRAELLDCFAVLTGHAHAHFAAALTSTRHLAAALAPPAVIRHAAPGLLRTRARWRSYLARYAACLGDERDPGSLRASFRTAYLDALHRDL